MANKTADPDDSTAAGTSTRKKLLLGAAAVAALGGAYQFVLAPDPAAEAGTGDATEVAPPEEGEILELPEVVINLAGEEDRYARVGLALVLEEGLVAKDFEAESAIAKDVALTYLSSLTYEQLRDPASKEQVKAELSHRIRTAYGEAKVVRALWTVLVMQ